MGIDPTRVRLANNFGTTAILLMLPFGRPYSTRENLGSNITDGCPGNSDMAPGPCFGRKVSWKPMIVVVPV